MAPTVTRSQSNRAPLRCGSTGESHHGCAADISAVIVWCYCNHVNMDQSLWGMFPVACWSCHKELMQLWRKKVPRFHGTSKVHIMNWHSDNDFNEIFRLCIPFPPCMATASTPLSSRYSWMASTSAFFSANISTCQNEKGLVTCCFNSL